MSPVYIKTRRAKKKHPRTGRFERYYVYWRRGGRAFKEEYGGSFETKKLADARAEAIAAELAAGRDPRALLDALKTPPPAAATLEQRWDELGIARIDVGPQAQERYRSAKKTWLPILGAGRDPHTITVQNIIDGIADQIAAGKAPATISSYHGVLAQVLDHADVDPNPARSPKVKLPRNRRKKKDIPSNETWLAIREAIWKRSLTAIDLEEACGLRVSEACALATGDIDFVDGMARIWDSKTEAGRRWVPVPRELLDRIEAGLPPLEDRHADQPALGVTADDVYTDIVRACKDAGAPRYGTHILRHRRISLWLRHGIDPVQVAAWSGHSRPSESLDTYGHEVIDPAGDVWRDFWLAAYAAKRSSGAAPVRHEELPEL